MPQRDRQEKVDSRAWHAHLPLPLPVYPLFVSIDLVRLPLAPVGYIGLGNLVASDEDEDDVMSRTLMDREGL